MKLIELSCDKTSFKTLQFNPEGITLIIGDTSKGGKEGSSNGVGKTLSLGLVHHCLGAQVNDKLKAAVPDWLFSLRFNIRQDEHIITRSGDGAQIYLDEHPIRLKELREWLNECGVFRIEPQIPGISFRSLFSRFARYAKEDCLNPLNTHKEEDADGKLRSLYLLGLDCSLAAAKKKDQLELLDIKKTKKTWSEDHVLKDIFRAGAKPRVRFEWLEQEIPKLTSALHAYQVAENYRLLEWHESELTKQLRQIEHQISILDFQLAGIEKALEEQPDITAADLRSFYDGLGHVFKPEALEHFEQVEAFHNTLSINRKTRLDKDKLKIIGEKITLEQEYKVKATERDSYSRNMQGKKALDEYAALAKHIAYLEEERDRLKTFLELEATLDLRIQEIRERRVADDRRTADYLRTKPYSEISKRFSSLARMLYPNDPAGIDIENNTGDNQVRYDIAVQIEGDDADGINSAKILCFDWTFYMYGANHTMDFLWHDNRLFAHMDPNPRAAWFSYVMRTLTETKKQYIASLNTENLDSMKECMSEGDWSALTASIQLKLHGDKPKNKLLGIQFGSQR